VTRLAAHLARAAYFSAMAGLGQVGGMGGIGLQLRGDFKTTASRLPTAEGLISLTIRRQDLAGS
jgi:hypothetical protein